MVEHYGATPDEWDHFAFNLELLNDLMPVVSNPEAKISPHSAMGAVGKTPSIYNARNQVVGIKGWTQSDASAADVERWRAQPDYGICIQTRNVRAIDCDIENSILAKDIYDEIEKVLGKRLPCRSRSNASKFLLAFEMPGEYSKRVIRTDYGIIEFLATGQQFIAAGRHPSGVHYEWGDGLPDAIPTLAGEQFEALWRRMVECFATDPSETILKSTPSRHDKLSEAIENDPIAQHILNKQVHSLRHDGGLDIRCPWQDKHTDKSGGDATYYPAHTGRHPTGHFQCRDPHCQGIPTRRFRVAIGVAAEDGSRECDIKSDPIAQHLYDKGVVRSPGKDGSLHIVCPFEAGHSPDSAVSSTTYLPPSTGGYERGNICCKHASCNGRTRVEFLSALGYEEGADDFDIVEADTGAEGDNEDARYRVEFIPEFGSHKPPSWLVKGVLPRASIAFIFGESGSGKTFFTLDIALAIARGVEWRGLKVKQGRVVYIAAEDATGVRHRVKAYLTKHGLTEADIPFFGVIDASPDFLKGEDVRDVLKAIRAAGGADMIVADTWAQITPGANENSGEDMGKALAYCSSLHRATGAVVTLIHHSGKDATKGARGWSGMRGAADCMIEVTRFVDQREASVYKLKNAPDGARFGFELKTVVVGEDEDGEDITSCVLEHTKAVPKAQRGKREPKGAVERIVMRVASDLCVGGAVPLADLTDAVVKQIPFDDEGGKKRDQRAGNTRRSIAALAGRGALAVDGNNIAMPC